ncbi:unnamed protein product [Dovyalis caffra]|uniref:Uncharacterized protein n=1 Tax=Dovyalis caffra TaxID=77055 RepID=A0AAV1RPC3_9ROSI|nr:unnamed protein product [Dovyalis caffra]
MWRLERQRGMGSDVRWGAGSDGRLGADSGGEIDDCREGGGLSERMGWDGMAGQGDGGLGWVVGEEGRRAVGLIGWARKNEED